METSNETKSAIVELYTIVRRDSIFILNDIVKRLFPDEFNELIITNKEMRLDSGIDASELLFSSICIELGLTRDVIKSKCRFGEYTFARMIYGWGLRTTSMLSLSRIGEHLDRDHSTILHYVRRCEMIIQHEPLKRDHIGRIAMEMHRHGYGQMLDEYRRILSEYKKPEKFL